MAVTVQRHGIHTGIGAVKPRERRFRRPGIADIILAAGAKGGRESFSVHKEFFISFAPPPVHALFIPLAIPPAFGRFFRSRPLVENMHMYATETSCCAANHQQRPIRPAVASRRKARSIQALPVSPMPLGMKAEHARGCLRFQRPCGKGHAEIMRRHIQVCHRHPAAFSIRHVEPAGKGRAFHGHGQAAVMCISGRTAEKIP